MTAPAVFDVAIVGLGPTGVVAAGLLARAGLTVYACDRQPDVYEIPRAIALDHEAMRVIQQLGAADAVAPWVEPFTPSEYYGVDGRLIRRMTMVEPPYPQGWTPSMVFSQPPVERALRRHVSAMPGVSFATATTMTALREDAEGVDLELIAEAGARRSVRARWVVGCDGGASAVRTALGIALEDLEFDEPWLVVDVRVNERGLAKLPSVSVQYCEPERPCTLVIGPGDHRRWEISLRPGEDPAQVATPEGTWALLSRWIGPSDGTLWRQAAYRFHALVASRWRRGRVFLAGDAAHMQPPFLGQGMCQGLRDAANLAWKLAAVAHGQVRGRGADALLDSYGVERKAHVRELTSRILRIGAVICERDEARARERDARMFAECGGTVRDTPRQDVLPRLESGLLSPQDTSGRGTLFPQPRLRTATGGTELMDERCGCGWRLVTLGPRPAVALPDAVRPIEIGPTGHEEAEGVVAAWMARHACTAALLRPDHYVFGTAADPAGVGALVDAWRHALRAGSSVPAEEPAR